MIRFVPVLNIPLLPIIRSIGGTVRRNSSHRSRPNMYGWEPTTSLTWDHDGNSSFISGVNVTFASLKIPKMYFSPSSSDRSGNDTSDDDDDDDRGKEACCCRVCCCDFVVPPAAAVYICP